MKCQIIENLYQEEAETSRDEFATIALSLPVNADHKFLLEALAERFGVSMASIARPMLEKALEDAFLTLKPSDQDSVAAQADKKTHAYLTKTAKERGGVYEHHGLGRWEGYAYVAQGKMNHQEAA